MLTDISSTCRTCLTPGDCLISLEKILPYHLEQKTYLECLRSCTLLDIPANVRYPGKICVRCSKALQVAYHFITMTRSSELKLENEEQNQNRKELEMNKRTLNKEDECPKIEPQFEILDEDEFQTITEVEKCDTAHSEEKLEIISEHQQFESTSEEQKDQTIPKEEKNQKKTVAEQQKNCFDLYFAEFVKSYSYASKNQIEHWSEFESAEPDENSQSNSERQKTIDDNLMSPKYFSTQSTVKQHQPLENDMALDDLYQNISIANENIEMEMRSQEASIRKNNYESSVKPIDCSLCGYSTCYAESLRKHYIKMHNIEVLNYDFLKIRSDWEDQMEYHEICYKCCKCFYKCYDRDDLIRHLNDQHLVSENPDAYIIPGYNCPDCKRNFKDRKGLNTHHTVMHGASIGIKRLPTGIYTCEYCDKQFQQRSSQVSHQRFCHLADPVKCHICSKKFTSMRRFDVHLRESHGIETIHECEVCQRRYNSSTALSLHRKRHSERHYQCELCPRNYINSTELKVHKERIHAKALGLPQVRTKCSNCDLKFTNLTQLNEHIVQEHQLQKFYKCPFCDFESISRMKVRMHSYVHTGKPYKCEFCGKEFTMRMFLRRHSLAEHGVKITEKQMGTMFHNTLGYPSRYDCFSKPNTSLEISEVSQIDIDKELKEFGLKIDDLITDLFKDEIV